MASDSQQRSCTKCQNGIATCSGCSKRFCLPHFTEHRQELDKRMDEVVREHSLIRTAFKPQWTMDHLLTRIDEWESISIKKIQDTAQQARTDLEACFDCTKNRLIDSLGNMAMELRSNQESTIYTEKELDRWMRQLIELRKTVENPPNINMVEDESTCSSIRMIKVVEKINSNNNSNVSTG